MRKRPSFARGPAALLVGLISVATGCSRTVQPDAYGNVEATAVTVAAETSGRLIDFTAREGDTVAIDATVGTIDATDLGLQRDQFAAERAANVSRGNEVSRQMDVLRAERDAAIASRDAARAQAASLDAQHEIALRADARVKRLYSQQAATAQQLDQAEKDVRVLEEQINAQKEQIKALDSQIRAREQQIEAASVQRQTVTEQVGLAAAQVAQVEARIQKTHIANPVAGTVLTVYARAGEFVQPGQPLYKIANLDSVEVRAYITEPQLSHVKIGGAVQISFDISGSERRSLTGTVSWISAEAEFTPTPVQTREERADLVYAVKIRVPNPDGVLKIGMPADVRFDQTGTAR